MHSQPQVLCLNQFKTVSPVGSFKTTFGLSYESEQIPYVLKQGSPDMSCVVITTCNRKDKNKCLSFTGSCKYCFKEGIYTASNIYKISCYQNLTLASTERHVSGRAQVVTAGLSYLQHHVRSTKTLYFSQCFRLLKCRTLRMELSCRVCLVSYPSRRHRRVVLPDPANSDRFKSAKPSCRRTQV